MPKRKRGGSLGRSAPKAKFSKQYRNEETPQKAEQRLENDRNRHLKNRYIWYISDNKLLKINDFENISGKVKKNSPCAMYVKKSLHIF